MSRRGVPGVQDSPRTRPPEDVPRPGDPEPAREIEVRRRLREAADPHGFLRFDRWVEIALYAPEVGFYTNPGALLGPHGEYYTAAHVSPLFGRAIARRIQMDREVAGPLDHWNVIEFGAGDGALAASLLPALTHGPGAEGLRYWLVERSGRLREVALERARAAAGSTLSVEAGESLAALGPLRGTIVANELLDALPFRRLVRRDGSWRELGVRWQDGALAWAETELSPAAPADLPPRADEGTIFELSPPAEALLREIADHLVAGSVLLIDYGAEESELLHSHPSGTLAAVRRHRTSDDPIAHPGLEDLSAFVNFTRIRRAARSCGLVERSFRSMRDCLIDWGIEGLIDEEVRALPGPEHEVRTRLAAKNLLLGFDSFRVLELTVPVSP